MRHLEHSAEAIILGSGASTNEAIRRRRLGDAGWVRLTRRNLTGWRGVDALRLAAAVLLYAALLLAHSPVIGVSPTVML